MAQFTPKWNPSPPAFYLDPFVGDIIFEDDSILDQHTDLIVEESNNDHDHYPHPPNDPFCEMFFDETLDKNSISPEKRAILDRWATRFLTNDFKGLLKDIQETEEPDELLFMPKEPLLILFLQSIENAKDLVTPILLELDIYYTDGSNYLPFQILQFFVEIDDWDSFQTLFDHFELPESSYQGFAHYAASQLSLGCLRSLFALDISYKLTPELYYHWVIQGLGNPRVDECARIIASQFTEWDPEEPTPFPLNDPVEICHYGSCPMDCLKALLCTPYMEHCLKQDFFYDFHMVAFLELLSVHFYRAVKPGLYISPSGFEATGVLPYNTLHYGATLKDTTYLHFNFFPMELEDPTYEQITHLTNLILDKFPHLVKRVVTRSLLVSLALVDEPCPRILERVQKLTGKQLAITDLDLPWFEFHEGQNTSLVKDTLYANWKERIPPKLYPVIRYSNFKLRHKPVGFLAHCTLLGSPNKVHLSDLGAAIFDLPLNHPLFESSLEEGGVLHRERTNFLLWLERRRTSHRGHYLKAISILQGGNDYEL